MIGNEIPRWRAAANAVFAADGYFYRSTSSRRYKTEQGLYDKGLEAIKKLRPVYYTGNGKIDGDTLFAGFIAEDVAEAGLHEFVALDDQGRPDALHYANMTALLTKALQEAVARIEALEAR